MSDDRPEPPPRPERDEPGAAGGRPAADRDADDVNERTDRDPVESDAVPEPDDPADTRDLPGPVDPADTRDLPRSAPDGQDDTREIRDREAEEATAPPGGAGGPPTAPGQPAPPAAWAGRAPVRPPTGRSDLSATGEWEGVPSAPGRWWLTPVLALVALLLLAVLGVGIALIWQALPAADDPAPPAPARSVTPTVTGHPSPAGPTGPNTAPSTTGPGPDSPTPSAGPSAAPSAESSPPSPTPSPPAASDPPTIGPSDGDLTDFLPGL